jgi:hypothetical protein
VLPPPPEPSLLDRAISTVESGLHELRDGASAFWDRATSWMHAGESHGTAPDKAAAPTPAAPSNANAPAAPAAPKPAATPPAAASPGPRPAPGGDTLDLAMSRAALGTGGTEYTRNGLPHDEAAQMKARLEELNTILAKHAKAVKANAKSDLSDDEAAKLKEEQKALAKTIKDAEKKLADDIASGGDEVTRFYCSGLSMWTLAAAGYDITKRLKGPDGTEYRGLIMTKDEVPVDAAGKPLKKGAKEDHKARVVTDTKYVTLRSLMDGDSAAIEIVALVKARRAEDPNASSTVEITGTGYQTKGEGDGLAESATGAAGAFITAGIGTKVEDERQQKPGDFAQSRRTTKGAGDDKELKHRGAGHAWQVSEVRAQGSALFGKDGSPEPEGAKLDGWHADVKFFIKPKTNPRLVGPHVVTFSKRVEAQDEGVVHDKKGDTNKDGGVQVTNWNAVPDTNPNKYTGYVVFYGRLSASAWSGWSPATKESAEAAAAEVKPVAPTAPTGEDAPSSEPLQPGTPAGELTGGDERSV